ncbi:MAG: MBL fold metallo-hydrolase, partial [Actinomycetota bacterium]
MTFYGVRGSTPCHGDDIVRYGGNTSCVALHVPGADPILFDMGTGLRYFGACRPADETFRGTFLLSHLHWDHIQGLPFFGPILQPAAEIDVYAPAQPDHRTVAGVFADTIRPPLFPIDLSALPGTMRFHDLFDDAFELDHPSGDPNDAIRVTSRFIPHVGPTLGYRVEWRGRSVVYMSDHQMPCDGSFEATPGALDLCRDADLVIHDAQYTPEEFE